MRHLLTTSLVLLSVPLFAQPVTVDYPDSVVTGTAGQYPIYTGTGLSVIRGQIFCPGTFAGLPTTPMFCTKVGIQLGAPAAGYAQFVLRFGATTIAALTSTWATNLPDQRVQLDLSNTTITPPVPPGWVEYQLKYPFYYTPGSGVVLDIISQAQVAGIYCRTALSSAPRLIDTNFVGLPTGPAPSTSGGIKFRMVFEPLAIVVAGTGCPGTGSFVPQISSTGQSKIGSFNYMVLLANALGGAPGAFLLGNPMVLPIGGGCNVYNDLLISQSLIVGGNGPGNGTASFPLFVPNNPALATLVLDAQWAILDQASQALAPVALTPAGKVVVY